MNFEAFLNVTVLPTGGWTLTGGISTVTGIKVNSNSIEFDDVKFDASQSTINFTIQGQQVNPSLWGPGFPFNEDVAAAGNYTLGIVDSIQLVGVNESVPEPATLLWCGLALCCLKARVARRDPRQA